MPYSLTVDHQNRRCTCVGSGVVSFVDIALYIADRIRQGAYHYSQLVDARDATVDIPPRTSVSGVLMDVRRELNVRSTMPRTAIVANPGTATFGIARQLATELGFANMKVEVFPSRADAESWLASSP